MKTLHTLTAIILVMLLSSCSGLSTKQIQEAQKPPEPESNTSEYSKALEKFSTMLEIYQQPETPLILFGKPVRNKTACANLPQDITQMVATAVNKLGWRIRYFHYNPQDPLYIEYKKMLLGQFGMSTNQIVPTLAINAAITQCDEKKDSFDTGFNTDITGSHNGNEGTVGGGGETTNNFSSLALDMGLLDYANDLSLPKINSTLEVDIKSIKGGYNFVFQVMGSGFGFNRSRKITQGKHEAIRALVDMSVLQVLGKYLNLPYWRCLPGALPDPFVEKSLEDIYLRVPQADGIHAIQVLLQDHGYSTVQATGIIDNITTRAIIDITSKSNCNAPAVAGPALYSYLYLNKPLDLSRLVSVMPPVTPPEPESTQTPEAVPAPAPEPVISQTPQVKPKKQTIQPALGLHTAVIYRPGKMGEVVLISGGKLRSGDRYKVIVEPEQDCYLYVFQRDSAGRLFPIFPHTNRNDGLSNPIRGSITYEFPGGNNYFFLDQRKGMEQIYFYSTTEVDQKIELAIHQLNRDISDQQKQGIEKELQHYLATKDTISTTQPGNSYLLKGKGSMQTVQMNRVQKLSKNKLYIFSFNHQ